MTNADKPKTYKDKYLKDGVDENTIDNLAVEMVRFFDDEFRKIDSKRFTSVVPTFITKFFEQPVKQTLTEDEKVILRHINTINIDRIGRHDCGDLILLSKSGGFYLMTTNFNFDGLFQFIKPRRRI